MLEDFGLEPERFRIEWIASSEAQKFADVMTEMTEALPQKTREEMLAQIPLRRFGTPEEVAHAVAFLASDAAAYLTGQVIHVNGGMIMI